MVEIRKARLKDIDNIVEVWKNFMIQQRDLGREFGDDRMPPMKADAPEIVKGHYNRTIRSKKGLLLVLEDDDGRIQGYMLSKIEKNIPVFENDHIGHIVSIYLEDPFRGKGYSSKMYEMTYSWFRSKGIIEVIIEVFTYNPHAHKVYEKWGFDDVHIMMKKKLD